MVAHATFSPSIGWTSGFQLRNANRYNTGLGSLHKSANYIVQYLLTQLIGVAVLIDLWLAWWCWPFVNLMIITGCTCWSNFRLLLKMRVLHTCIVVFIIIAIIYDISLLYQVYPACTFLINCKSVYNTKCVTGIIHLHWDTHFITQYLNNDKFDREDIFYLHERTLIVSVRAWGTDQRLFALSLQALFCL